MMNRLFTIPALALLLTISGCNFSDKKASEALPSKQAESEMPDELFAADTQSANTQSADTQSDEAQSDSQEAFLRRLTKNKERAKSLELIAVHDGRVYSQLAWGSLSERGWQYAKMSSGNDWRVRWYGSYKLYKVPLNGGEMELINHYTSHI